VSETFSTLEKAEALNDKTKKNKKTAILYVVFNPGNYYNDLFFNVFNIIAIEKVVNVKYSTKNNNINDNEVFLAIKNHIRAIISSIRNLRVTLTSVKNGWLSVSLLCPAINITRQIIELT
jgi:hypothetical protein